MSDHSEILPDGSVDSPILERLKNLMKMQEDNHLKTKLLVNELQEQSFDMTVLLEEATGTEDNVPYNKESDKYLPHTSEMVLEDVTNATKEDYNVERGVSDSNIKIHKKYECSGGKIFYPIDRNLSDVSSLPKFPFLKKGQGTFRYNYKTLKGFQKKKDPCHKLPKRRLCLNNVKQNPKENVASQENMPKRNDIVQENEKCCGLSVFEKLEELVEHESFVSTSSGVQQLLMEDSLFSTPVLKNKVMSARPNPHIKPNVSNVKKCQLTQKFNYPMLLYRDRNETDLSPILREPNVNDNLYNIEDVIKPSPLSILKKSGQDNSSSKPIPTISKVHFMNLGVEVLEYEEDDCEQHSVVTGCSEDSDLISLSDLENLALLNYNKRVVLKERFCNEKNSDGVFLISSKTSSSLQNYEPLSGSSALIHRQPRSPTLIHHQSGSPTLIHRQSGSPTLIHRQPRSPTLIHRQSGSPTLIHCQPRSPTLIHRQSGSPTLIHRQPRSPTLIHCQPSEHSNVISSEEVIRWDALTNEFKEDNECKMAADILTEEYYFELNNKLSGNLSETKENSFYGTMAFTESEHDKYKSLLLAKVEELNEEIENFQIKNTKVNGLIEELKEEKEKLLESQKAVQRNKVIRKGNTINKSKENDAIIAKKLQQLTEKISHLETENNLLKRKVNSLEKKENLLKRARDHFKCNEEIMGEVDTNNQINNIQSKPKWGVNPRVSNKSDVKKYYSNIKMRNGKLDVKHKELDVKHKDNERKSKTVRSKLTFEAKNLLVKDNDSDQDQDPNDDNDCSSDSDEANKQCNVLVGPLCDSKKLHSTGNQSLYLYENKQTYKNLDLSVTVKSGGNESAIYHPNGDIETRYPDRIVYFYSDVKITDTRYKDGTKVIEFPDGQKETYFADGSQQILLADGSSSSLHQDGIQQMVSCDGTKTVIKPDGTKMVDFPNGQREVYLEDRVQRIYPDGTIRILHSDGKLETRYRNGKIRIKDKDGNTIISDFCVIVVKGTGVTMSILMEHPLYEYMSLKQIFQLCLEVTHRFTVSVNKDPEIQELTWTLGDESQSEVKWASFIFLSYIKNGLTFELA